MEVRPGYKQTEVGVIPGDWSDVSITSVARLESGHTPSKKNPNYWNGAVQWISLHDTDKLDALEIHSTTQTITEDGLKNSSARLLPAGTVAFSRTATVGKCCVMARAMATSQDFACYVCGPSLNNYFLVYLFRGMDRVWRSLMAGSIHNTIYMPVFKALKIQLPQIEEQRAIATALSDMDTLLNGLERLIAKKRDIKQATMQQLLTGQTRLPGFSEEWEVKRLEDLADIRSGGTPSTGDAAAWDGAVPWCTPTDITALQGGKYLTTTNRTITEHGLHSSSAELIPARSIVMTSRATIGECAINIVPMTTNQGFKNLVPFDFVNVEFLYYLLCTQTQGLVALSAGSTFLEIGKTQIRRYEVSLPSTKNEQAAIATILSDIDTEITALETRRTKTHALKQAMMQELLTGRTRLVTPDEEAVPQAEGRKPNVHFLRSVLAAEIIDQLHDQPTFGHVKFEKMMFLAEHLCEVDTGSTYHRKAAGPYDNRALRSIDSQLQKQQWFEARKQDGRYQYVPLAKRGGHKPYFDRHFSRITETLEKILSTFKTFRTEQCEIVATLLAAWSDLLREKGTVSDEMIMHEVLHNWHEAKQRIPEDRWLAALGWMREKGFVPKGAT